LGFSARVAIAPHKLVYPSWRDAGGFKPKRKTGPAIQVEGWLLGFFGLVVLPSHHINSSIRRGAMLAASKRNERHARPFKLKRGVAIAPHKLVNPSWRDAGGFKPKRKTCQISRLLVADPVT
jgi:hypothetical protein